MMPFDFTGKNFLITGASSGIGKSIAQYLSGCGASIILVARNLDKLSKLLEELPKSCKMFAYDLNNLEDIQKIFEYCRHHDMALNGLIHCAGICPLMTLKENDISVMIDTFKVNYFSFVELVKYFSEERNSVDNSSIVAISSDAAVVGGYRQAIYGGSKAALNVTVKSMARELQYRKIRINTIMPSAVETEMLDKLRKKSLNLEDKILSKQPLGIINPDNIASLAGYLLSDEGKYMTGLSIPVNAGHIY